MNVKKICIKSSILLNYKYMTNKPDLAGYNFQALKYPHTHNYDTCTCIYIYIDPKNINFTN